MFPLRAPALFFCGEDSGVALGAGALPFRVRPLRADVALDTDTFVLATEKEPISGEETRTILSHTFSTVPATPPYLREPLTTTGVPTLSGLAGEAAGGGGVDIVREVRAITFVFAPKDSVWRCRERGGKTNEGA